MKLYLKYIILLAAFAIVRVNAATENNSVHCPGKEIASISYTVTGEIEFDDPVNSNMTGKVRLQDTTLMFPIAAMPINSLQFVAAAGLGWARLDFGGYSNLYSHNIYYGMMALSVEYPLKQDFGWNITIMPAYYGEARLMAQSVAKYRLGPEWELQLGAAWDDAFGEPQLFPVGGVVWQPNEEFNASLLFPNTTINWAPNKNFNLFTFLQPSGHRWVDDFDDDSKAIFVIEGWRAGLGLEPKIWERLRLRIAGGTEFARHYKIKKEDVLELDRSVNSTWFINIALVLY